MAGIWRALPAGTPQLLRECSKVHMQSGELVAATGMLVRVWASLVNTEREYTQRQRLARAQWAHVLLLCFLSL